MRRNVNGKNNWNALGLGFPYSLAINSLQIVRKLDMSRA